MDDDGSNVLVLDQDTYLTEQSIGVTKDWVLYNATDGYKHPALKRIMKDGANKTTMGGF